MSIEKIDDEEKKSAKLIEKSTKAAEKQTETVEKNDKKREQTIADCWNDNAKALANQVTTTLGIDTSVGFAENMKNVTCDLISRSTNAGTPMFNPAEVLSQLKAIIEPFNKAMAMLKQVVGNIPGLSEISSIFGLLTSGANSAPAADQNSQLPELPADTQKNLQKIRDNIMTFCSQLPMMFIHMLFAIVKKLFELVTQLFKALCIKLENIFPLNLINDAMATIQSVKNFMTNAPGEIQDMTEGILRQNLKIATDAAKPIVNAVNAATMNKKVDDARKPNDDALKSSDPDMEYCARIMKFYQDMEKAACENVKDVVKTEPIQTIVAVPQAAPKKEEAKTQDVAKATSSLPTNVVSPG